MSVVEKPVTEKAVPTTPQDLGLASLAGGAIVLLALWVILAGFPFLWGQVLQSVDPTQPLDKRISYRLDNAFLDGTMLLLATALLMVGLGYVVLHLERNVSQPGLRAGAFFGALFIYLVAWLTIKVGSFLQTREMETLDWVLTIAIGLGMAYGVYRMFRSEGFKGWLLRMEDQGWFHAIPYKPTQGVRVRRGTVLAVLVVGVCGIITMVSHGSLGSDRHGPNDWDWVIPFTGTTPGAGYFIPLMYKVHVTVPILCAIALMWFAWRLVNWPAFGDFLIATEAEMNKVSWTTRRRLVQDTIVVLVTVFLLTTFLFIVDIAWIKILSWNPIRVLAVDFKAEVQKQQEKTQW